MKVFQINSVCGIRSTGRICTDLAELLEERGHQCKIAYGREKVPEKYQKYAVEIGSKVSTYSHAKRARLFDCAGFGSKRATKRLIKQIIDFNPDIIHLHNLHGYYIHVGELFKFLKNYNRPVLWSFYDCWSFTGHCAHFDFNGCDKWKTDCAQCKHKSEYPKSLVIRAKRNYQKKKSLFTNVPKLRLIVPSKWMASMVAQSYMQDYPVSLLPNCIDLTSFSLQESDFKEKNGLIDKFVVLGVSSFWNKLKGLEFFNRLADELDEDKYKVVLVGKGEESEISNKILHIPATNNIKQLCEIYTMADVFVNPTLQETQGLTTVESFACGTPAIVFKAGGAPECVDNTCGITIEKGDYKGLIESVKKMQSGEIRFNSADCIKVANKYDAKQLYQNFISLYEEIGGKRNI